MMPSSSDMQQPDPSTPDTGLPDQQGEMSRFMGRLVPQRYLDSLPDSIRGLQLTKAVIYRMPHRRYPRLHRFTFITSSHVLHHHRLLNRGEELQAPALPDSHASTTILSSARHPLGNRNRIYVIAGVAVAALLLIITGILFSLGDSGEDGDSALASDPATGQDEGMMTGGRSRSDYPGDPMTAFQQLQDEAVPSDDAVLEAVVAEVGSFLSDHLDQADRAIEAGDTQSARQMLQGLSVPRSVLFASYDRRAGKLRKRLRSLQDEDTPQAIDDPRAPQEDAPEVPEQESVRLDDLPAETLRLRRTLPKSSAVAWNMVRTYPEDHPVRILVKRQLRRDLIAKMEALDGQLESEASHEELETALRSIYIPPRSDLEDLQALLTSLSERVAAAAPAEEVDATPTLSPSTGTDSPTALPQDGADQAAQVETTSTETDAEKDAGFAEADGADSPSGPNSDRVDARPDSGIPTDRWKRLQIDQVVATRGYRDHGDSIDVHEDLPRLLAGTTIPLNAGHHLFESERNRDGQHTLDLPLPQVWDTGEYGQIALLVRSIDGRRRDRLTLTLSDSAGASVTTDVAIPQDDGDVWQYTTLQALPAEAIDRAQVTRMQVIDPGPSTSPFFIADVVLLPEHAEQPTSPPLRRVQGHWSRIQRQAERLQPSDSDEKPPVRDSSTLVLTPPGLADNTGWEESLTAAANDRGFGIEERLHLVPLVYESSWPERLAQILDDTQPAIVVVLSTGTAIPSGLDERDIQRYVRDILEATVEYGAMPLLIVGPPRVPLSKRSQARQELAEMTDLTDSGKFHWVPWADARSIPVAKDGDFAPGGPAAHARLIRDALLELRLALVESAP